VKTTVEFKDKKPVQPNDLYTLVILYIAEHVFNELKAENVLVERTDEHGASTWWIGNMRLTAFDWTAVARLMSEGWLNEIEGNDYPLLLNALRAFGITEDGRETANAILSTEPTVMKPLPPPAPYSGGSKLKGLGSYGEK